MLKLKLKKKYYNTLYIYLVSYNKNIFKKLFKIYFFKLFLYNKSILKLQNKKKLKVNIFKTKPLSYIYKFLKIKRQKITVVRSPFVNKKSKEQFERLSYRMVLKTNILDFLIFLFLLKNESFLLKNLNIKYKVKSIEQGKLIF